MDALDRISKVSMGYSALYLHVSKLRPKNRHQAFVKVFARLFDSVIGSTRGYFFILSNSDFVVLSKYITPEAIGQAIEKLKTGLANDPVLHRKDTSEFATIYHFPERFSEFYRLIETVANNQEPYQGEEVVELRPLESSDVDEVIAELGKIDIAELVKRQSIVKFQSTDDFKVLFQEFFVAVKDLRLQFGEEIDLTANRWLFMYLSQTLDKQIMSAFIASDFIKWPKKIGINLNMQSVFLREFEDFVNKFPIENRKMIIETRLAEVFNDLDLYFEMKKRLHDQGHEVLIDELSSSAMKMLDIRGLQPDMIKIFWEPLLEFGPVDEELKEIISSFGPEKVVLAKCDSDKAVKWGVAHGITAFQGSFIDTMEVALIRNKCPNVTQCTSLVCLKRKRHLAGEFKDECAHKEMLDNLL